MFGRLVAGLIVVGLAIGVWAVWPDGETDSTTTTIAGATPTTSTTATTPDPSTTTTSGPDDSDIVETVAEAEEILRNFWFGWFEGIYNQDEERIKKVVASQNQLDAAISQFGVMEFSGLPTRDGIQLTGTEIVRADIECAAIWSTASFTFRGPGSTTGLEIYRWTDDGWKFVNSWTSPDDLWEQDCEAQLEPLS